jgi:hypothetical protein
LGLKKGPKRPRIWLDFRPLFRVAQNRRPEVPWLGSVWARIRLEKASRGLKARRSRSLPQAS